MIDFKSIKNLELINDPDLGNLVLQLRFSAKFHLQMCSVLSDAERHEEALVYARISKLICFDNILKTNILRQQIHNEYKRDKANIGLLNEEQKMALEVFESDFLDNVEEYFLNLDKILAFLIDLNKTEEGKDKILPRTKNIVFSNNFINQNSEQNLYKISPELKKNIKFVLSSNTDSDWLNFLNIGNIMYLSSLNIEDLDLESESKFELLRDAMVEKVKDKIVKIIDCHADGIPVLHGNRIEDVEEKRKLKIKKPEYSIKPTIK
jgi:hypothetical protein